MTERRVVGCLLLALLAASVGVAEEPAAPSSASGAAARVIRIQGSGYTMPDFTEPWAAHWNESSGVRVELSQDGTSTGPPALLRGQADIAAMTRPMNPAEVKAFERRRGFAPTAVPVAADALALFVHEGNPLTELTLRQVDAVFSGDRRCGAASDAARWSDLGVAGEIGPRSIALYGRHPASGTATFFRDVALCGGPFKSSMRVHPGAASAAMAVAESRLAIGFGSTADLRPGIRVLALATEAGGAPILPSASAVHDGRYPLGRLLYFYLAVAPGEPLDAELRDFLRYVLSSDAQRVVEAAGYLPVPEELLAQTRARLLD